MIIYTDFTLGLIFFFFSPNNNICFSHICVHVLVTAVDGKGWH